MSEFPFPSADTSTVDGVLLYADCRHRWWEKVRDWLRFRRHPATHALWYGGPLYRAARDALLSAEPYPLDGDTVRVHWEADGTFWIEGRE